MATLFVLNSHMEVCYGDYSFLATGGSFGDALFFFVSGFTLFMGKKDGFVNWYKRRIGRIYPTVIIVGFIACLVLQKEISFMSVMMMDGNWFLPVILTCYVFLYPVVRYDLKLEIIIPAVIAIMLVVFFGFCDFHDEKYYFYGVDSYFRYILFFSVMLFGGLVQKRRESFTYKWWTIPALIASIIVWYVIMYLDGHGDWAILSYIPLIFTCILTYMVGKAPFIQKICNKKVLGNIIYIIGGLCLESYMIQGFIFTDALNFIFPLNVPIIMLFVLLASGLVHCLSEIIRQCFDSKDFEWEKLFLFRKDLIKKK